MRTLTGIMIGATIITLWHVLGWPWIGWLFTRIEPATPNGWKPKMRTWKNGEPQ